MKKISIIFTFIIISLFTSTSLQAAGIPIIYGHYEDINKIVNVKLTDKQNRQLFLGYKTDSFYIEAGVFIKDQGYVLGIENGNGSYYPMPTGESLKYYQKNGLLPNPLPSYNIPILEYIKGYSLWIILFLFIAYYIGKYVSKKEENTDKID